MCSATQSRVIQPTLGSGKASGEVTFKLKGGGVMQGGGGRITGNSRRKVTEVSESPVGCLPASQSAPGASWEEEGAGYAGSLREPPGIQLGPDRSVLTFPSLQK